MFAVPASFVSFILQAWSNLRGIKGLACSLVEHFFCQMLPSPRIFNFHVTQIFILLSADFFRYVIQICSLQSICLRVCVCVWKACWVRWLSQQNLQGNAKSKRARGLKSGVLKNAWTKTPSIPSPSNEIKRHHVVDDDADNLSSSALIPRQDSDRRTGYHGTL